MICIGIVVYNVCFHPLRAYPGPWLARASRVPFLYYQVSGRLPQKVRGWHERYGSTIRIAPNDLSFTQSQAWFDIHGTVQPSTITYRTSLTGVLLSLGHRSGTKTVWFERDPSVYPPLPRAPSIVQMGHCQYPGRDQADNPEDSFQRTRP